MAPVIVVQLHMDTPNMVLPTIDSLLKEGRLASIKATMQRRAMSITTEQLGNWFTYHSPDADQLPKYKVIREAGLALAATIVANTPTSADQTAAIRKVREAVMTANAAIACKGQ